MPIYKTMCASGECDAVTGETELPQADLDIDHPRVRLGYCSACQDKYESAVALDPFAFRRSLVPQSGLLPPRGKVGTPVLIRHAFPGAKITFNGMRVSDMVPAKDGGMYVTVPEGATTGPVSITLDHKLEDGNIVPPISLGNFKVVE
jgi:hypothetical protein